MHRAHIQLVRDVLTRTVNGGHVDPQEYGLALLACDEALAEQSATPFPVLRCPDCATVFPSGAIRCPRCGLRFGSEPQGAPTDETRWVSGGWVRPASFNAQCPECSGSYAVPGAAITCPRCKRRLPEVDPACVDVGAPQKPEGET